MKNHQNSTKITKLMFVKHNYKKIHSCSHRMSISCRTAPGLDDSLKAIRHGKGQLLQQISVQPMVPDIYNSGFQFHSVAEIVAPDFLFQQPP